MEQIPSDRARAARIALAVLAGTLGTALIAGGIWFAFRPEPPQSPRQTEIEPAEETTSATPTVPGSIQETESSAASSTTETAKPRPQGGGLFDFGKTQVKRVAKVAYRMRDRVWVAGEDGKGAVAVCYGYRAYRLSPDAKTLAVVPDAHEPMGPKSETSAVRLLDVRRTAVDAVAEKPSWAGTSQWLAFTGGSSGTFGAFRVDAAGAPLRRLAPSGSSPKASMDGKHVCYLKSSASGGSPKLVVATATGGSAKGVGKSEGASSWEWGPDGALFFVRAGEQRGTWELWLSKPPFSTSTRVGTVDLAPPAFALADLSVSFDGRRVLASAMGDDDYSRLWVFDASDRRFHTIPTRRDAFPYGWSADGSRILYFEGNTYQGEPTSLMSCRADGSGRKMVVEGAGR